MGLLRRGIRLVMEVLWCCVLGFLLVPIRISPWGCRQAMSH